MKKPRLTIYAITKSSVDVHKAKKYMKKKLKATRLSVLESDDINSFILSVPLRKLNKAWTYLEKKRGIKRIWLGS